MKLDHICNEDSKANVLCGVWWMRPLSSFTIPVRHGTKRFTCSARCALSNLSETPNETKEQHINHSNRTWKTKRLKFFWALKSHFVWRIKKIKHNLQYFFFFLLSTTFVLTMNCQFLLVYRYIDIFEPGFGYRRDITRRILIDKLNFFCKNVKFVINCTAFCSTPNFQTNMHRLNLILNGGSSFW